LENFYEGRFRLMSVIQPFRGYRPRKDVVEKVASPPYDVLSSDEARTATADNPLSFLHIVKAEIDLDPSVDVHSEEVYRKSNENLLTLIRDGILVRDETPCFYVYQQKMGGHVQAGLVAGASVDEYQKGLIKKHEHTRPDKETDRAKHIEILGANAGPVFLTYRASQAVNEIINQVREEEPEYDFTAEDGVVHTLWVVSDDDTVKALGEAFKDIPCLYVADGHHRSAAASRVREIRKEANPDHTGKEQYNYFLTVIFPHDQMQILDYNRVVKDLGSMSEEEFLEKVSVRFHSTPTDDPKPRDKGTFGMYLGGKWYRFMAKPDTLATGDPVESLDVAILQNNLLGPVLGIRDPRTDPRIDFVGGIRGLKELERRCAKDAAVAFALYPTSVNELINIADAGKVMPPKSTWFEPKLRSGIVVKMLEE
jgi:uncharacterized protein (DUF1015 family)